MAGDYLQNAWYAAAWLEDVTQKPLGRMFLDQPVVLYRTASGEAIALADTCPHRLAPLHLGQVHGDTLACPYHGLQFGPDGACVHNPHGPVPPGAGVRRYPLAQAHGLHWIWMGDAPADCAALPVVPELALPGLAWVKGMLNVGGNYQLVIDNLLDLTHVEFLHPLLGTAGSSTRTRYEARLLGDAVLSSYDLPNEPPSFVVRMLWPDAPDAVHMSSPIRWNAPSNLVLDLLVTHVGGDLADPYLRLPTCHFLTPASATRTHYFWLAGRNRATDSEDVGNMTRLGIEQSFLNEDEPMVAAIQARMAEIDVAGVNRVVFKTDAAAVQARRALARLIDASRKGREAVLF